MTTMVHSNPNPMTKFQNLARRNSLTPTPVRKADMASLARRQSLKDKPNLTRRESQQFYEEEAPSREVSKVREFEFAVIGGRPCRIIEKNKLGNDMCQIVARDLFTWDSIDEVLNSDEIVPEPLLVKQDYILANIDEEEYTLVDPTDSHVLKMPRPVDFIHNKIKMLLEKQGDVMVTVGRTPIEEGICDYRVTRSSPVESP